ncbi:hornerin-like isoform X3 [Odontomachus brunneus]|uniref:hornerin-like isoform X2 n=1 Tax=Odontomachus brunneus TaxID=486640 RepID=UPI0013F23DF6|nr:hornerin-like isoform X2 [Odontomachus brunneus]XP_032685749.1 hornerin-like isoform X3 [Odontomachus brunneus]
MAVGQIIVLSALFAQALSAPSGCIESCNLYHSSYQSRQTSGGYQDHAGLIQGSTNLNERDYAKPGNWTEHNRYDTDNGHGKVHEERGQYVEGSKRVRYYKKNFTSSYGTGNVGDAGMDGTIESDQLTGHRRHESIYVPSNLDSQSAYNQAGATLVTKESGYNRVHSQQTHSSSRKTNNQSERLEDFGEYGGHSQVNQHVSGDSSSSQTSDTSYHTEMIPQNWSRVDSYGTDGGHGRVFEEEGQYVTGPKKVRYFKKNYTSSYSTSGVPQVDVGSTNLQDLHHELQQNLHKQLDDFRREFHQTSNVDHVTSSAHTNSAQSLTQETVGSRSDDLQTAESDTYRQQLTHHRVPSTGTMHHYADQQQREISTDTRQHIPYTYPSTSAGTYGTDSQRTYQSHETYVSQVHPTSQPTHLPHLSPASSGYLQRPIIRDNYQSNLHNVHSIGHHAVDDTQRAIASSTHQSSIARNQLFADNSQHVYHPSPNQGTYPSRQGQTTHYEEHWSSSSRTGGNLYPDRSMSYGHANRAHYDRDAYNEHLNRHRTAAQGYDSHAHTSGNTYNSAYRTSSGQLVTGSLDLSHVAQGAADCNEEVQQYQQESRYHRKYKRDDHHGFVDEHQHQTTEHDDLTQQHQEFGQESQQLEGLTQQSQRFGQQTVGSQHMEDLTQQSEQFTQQTEGSDDFTQQTSGKLEFGQQTGDNQHLEDLTQQSEQITQQTSGKLEFGQQTADNQHLSSQHMEDLTQQSEQFTQQTEGSDDFTQQTSGKLEFGQQTGDNQHLEDLTQQSEQFTQQTEGSDDFTQQTSGKLEFGQQTVGNEHLKDSTQQTESQLEFGQHTVGNLHVEDLTQQSEQFEQQTAGSDDFTQQTVGEFNYGQTDSQQLKHLTQIEQLSQRTERSDDVAQQSSKLEFGQQTVDNQHLEDLTQQTEDDFTQQTSGKLEFGQHTVGDQHLGDLTQQTEQFEQQTAGSDRFAQQTSKLELGQQTVGHQHSEDLTQQIKQFGQQTTGSNDFTQQTSDKLEFGQQTVGNHYLEDLTQQTEQFGQQTTGSHDFTQQTNSKLEFGHTVHNQHLKDLTQQSEQITQQMDDKLEFGQHVQPIDKVSKPKNQHLEEFNHHFTQQTEGSDEFTQQTMGHLEFAQQMQQPQRSGNRHLEDFSQQDKDLTQQDGGFDYFTQQTTRHSEQGQQREQQWKPVRPRYDDQYTEHSSQQNRQNKEFEWQLGQMLPNTDFNQDFTQQTDHDQQTVIRPASKPKPRQRHQKQDSNPSHINIDDISKPIEINPQTDIGNRNEDRRTVQYGSGETHPQFNYHNSRIVDQQSRGSNGFDNEKENIDRLHWVHKSNDATVGLQWHYTYHPSDLTNVESSHNTYYPQYNSMSQQTEQQQKPFDFSQQETQGKHTFDFNQETQSTHTSETSPLYSQVNERSVYTPVIPLQNTGISQETTQLNKQSSQAEPKLESRILEVYGGGPYDALRNDDIYRRITPKPSATLPPIYDREAWDIREKPREREMKPVSMETTFSPINKLDIDKVDDVSTTKMIETTTQVIETTTKEDTSSFWSRVGHKITSTYDKAKEKAKEIFG